MTLAETIYRKSLTLPPEKAREVLDFIDFIKDRSTLPDNEGATNRQESHQKQCLKRPDRPPFSQRWKGRLAKSPLSEQEPANDPKLAYLAQRFNL